LTDGTRTAVSVIGAAGFAAAFPADFPALRFSTAFPSGGLAGFLATSPIYFFFFFAAFLAFLFFAITSLHQKLKKQSTAPVK
jgi:uncharacterized membrane protein